MVESLSRPNGWNLFNKLPETIFPLDTPSHGVLIELVRYVNRFPNICLEFTAQGIFVRNLRLPILNRLSSHGLRDQATERSRVCERREKARLFVLLCG